MTETAPKSAARLLAEAEIILQSPFVNGWPDAFSVDELAALMAGGTLGPHEQAYKRYRQSIFGASKSFHALAACVKYEPPRQITRDATAEEIAEHRANPSREGTFPGVRFQARRDGGLRAIYVKMESPSTVRITPEPFAAWLRDIRAVPPDVVRAWLGPAWQEEAPTVIRNPARNRRWAEHRRPDERQEYFSSLWIKEDRPARNEKIWKAMQRRKGTEGCPVVDVDSTNETFTFRYSDGATDTLQKGKFQQDMSTVRGKNKG